MRFEQWYFLQEQNTQYPQLKYFDEIDEKNERDLFVLLSTTSHFSEKFYHLHK